MAQCKCGLSDAYPECNGTHNALKNEKLREAILKAFKDNEHLLEEQMPKQWEDKSQWITNCPICYCAVTHQLRDYHIQYHDNIGPNQ